MAQNDQQCGYGQTAPPTIPTPAVTMESASFQNINNIDPALRGDVASSSSLIPCDPKKRSRDDEDGEVLGRLKVQREIEPKGKEKEVVENPRKRRGSLLGPEMCSTPSGTIIHHHLSRRRPKLTNNRSVDDAEWSRNAIRQLGPDKHI